MLKEFKEFALKGNIVDMAIGVIIGGAFGKIVTSLVNDIVMPLLSILIGNIDFASLYVTLGSGENAATLNYGLFITAIIDFLLISFSIFMVIKQISRIQKKINKPKEQETPPAAPTTKECPFCKTQIHIEAVKCPNCTSELCSICSPASASDSEEQN